MDNAAKSTEIQRIIGSTYIPRTKYNEEKQKSTDAYEALNKEYSEYKQSKMTDDEKQTEAVNKLIAENKKMKLDMNKAKAESIFSGAGLKEEDYSEILEDIVGEDSERTQKIASSICKIMSNQKESVKEKIKQEIASGTPKPTAGEPVKKAEVDKATLQKEFDEAVTRGDYVKMATYQRQLQEIELKGEMN